VSYFTLATFSGRAAATRPREGPMVRIHLPPAESLQTFGSSAGEDRGFESPSLQDAADARVVGSTVLHPSALKIFALSAPTPFVPSEAEALKRAAADVIEHHFPDAPALYARRGWRLPTSIGRVRNELWLRIGSASHGRQAALHPSARLVIAERNSRAVIDRGKRQEAASFVPRWRSHGGRLRVEAGIAARKLMTADGTDQPRAAIRFKVRCRALSRPSASMVGTSADGLITRRLHSRP
jgi:hypothetical protein